MAPTALVAVEGASCQRSDRVDTGSVVAPCPDTARYESISLQVVDENDRGLDGIAIILINPSGMESRQKTGPDGICGFVGLTPVQHRLALPGLDQDAWILTRTDRLEDTLGATSPANWVAPRVAAPAVEITHNVEQGECIAKLAEHYGFFPGTIWDYPANAGLRALRKDLHILAPGDRVVIPGKRVKYLPVSAGTRVTIRRKGVPERLRIRFLAYDEAPRAGLTFILAITMLNGSVLPDLKGTTDDAGFVDVPVPPGASVAEIVLIDSLRVENFRIKLGCMDPADTVSGWQARLNNLGYHCGAEDGQLGERTRSAIRAFQRAKAIRETGEMDAATRDVLERLALS